MDKNNPYVEGLTALFSEEFWTLNSHHNPFMGKVNQSKGLAAERVLSER